MLSVDLDTQFNEILLDKFYVFKSSIYKCYCNECKSKYNEKAKSDKISLYINDLQIEKLKRIFEYKLIYFNKFKELVKKRNGQLLGSLIEYDNAHSKLKVKCVNEHNFDITLSNLNLKKWCPLCNTKLGEYISIKIMEYLFDKKFIKVRPDWLKNNEGNKLELDGFNEELKLAIEYNGVQHYKQIHYFCKTQENFDKRKRDDGTKLILCKEKEINLIVVPYNIDHNKLCHFIANECRKLKYDFVNNPDSFDLDNCIVKVDSKIDEFNKLISSKNGEWIDGNYVCRESEVTIQCDKGHQWTTKIKYIKNGAWCHTCSYEQTPERKDNIAKGMKKFLETKKGKKSKAESFIKRSQTMKKQREELRNNIQNKKCGSCDIIRNIAEFDQKSAAKDGFQSYCRECIYAIKKLKREQLKREQLKREVKK